MNFGTGFSGTQSPFPTSQPPNAFGSNMFGTPQSPGFGASNGTSLFGTTPTTSSGQGGIFGSNSGGPLFGSFGNNRPSFGSTSNPTGFGASTTMTGFGGGSSTNLASDGSQGTYGRKFEPVPEGSDSTTGNTSQKCYLFCISAMHEFRECETELLRAADYKKGHKRSSGQFPSPTGKTNTFASPGGFGVTPSTGSTGFGTGFRSGSTFGATNVFSASQNSSGGFGSTFGNTGSAFGQPTTSSTFGTPPTFGNTGGSSIFGQPSTFVQPSGTSIFGAQPNQTQSPSLFGSNPSSGGFGGGFGQQPSSSIFGQPAQSSAFGATPAQGFGSTTFASGSLFGNQTSSSGFAFGSSNPSGSLFKPTNPTSSLFNPSSTPSNPFGGFQAPSIFGNAPQNPQTGSLFGASQSQVSSGPLFNPAVSQPPQSNPFVIPTTFFSDPSLKPNWTPEYGLVVPDGLDRLFLTKTNPDPVNPFDYMRRDREQQIQKLYPYPISVVLDDPPKEIKTEKPTWGYEPFSLSISHSEQPDLSAEIKETMANANAQRNRDEITTPCNQPQSTSNRPSMFSSAASDADYERNVRTLLQFEEERRNQSQTVDGLSKEEIKALLPIVNHPDYYLSPKMDGLEYLIISKGKDALKSVPGVEIGHRKHGKISFAKPVRLEKVDIAKSIIFKRGMIKPTEDSPFQNVPATVTLFKVFPKGKESLSPDEFQGALESMKKSTARIPAHFVSYDENGTWVIRISEY